MYKVRVISKSDKYPSANVIQGEKAFNKFKDTEQEVSLDKILDKKIIDGKLTEPVCYLFA